jgi:hypothetical protein
VAVQNSVQVLEAHSGFGGGGLLRPPLGGQLGFDLMALGSAEFLTRHNEVNSPEFTLPRQYEFTNFVKYFTFVHRRNSFPPLRSSLNA